MGPLRILLRRNALATWMVIAAAVLMKAIVPAGFMPERTASGIAVVLCPGMATAPERAGVMPGMAAPALSPPRKGHDQAPAKPDVPCAFAGLTAPSFGGIDLVLPAIAIAATLAAARLFAPNAPIARRAFLRPPLRGPPAIA
ncbi:DUF2946 family protein [Sphingomonas sp. PAMC 26617]|uniref:DUF2946 family protein n=1 Tax=Sphingomonas sp. PAMC 26617 TaxID=1112216 RepID=UPI000289F3F8|nr:DUF2946 family protein [Sphingomonas sp. PAMC 26617]